MILELNGYASALWVASCVSLATAAVAWTRHTRFPGGRQFALMMTCVVIWSATAALEAGAQEVSAKLVLSKIGYIGIAGVAPLFLQYALSYARKEIRWRLSRALLWMMPVITVGLVLTNELHHLVWTTLVPVSTAHGQILLYGHGTWYWAWVAYYGGVTLTAVAVLVPSAFQYRRIYVWQTTFILIAAALPWVGEALYLSPRTPFPGLDSATIGLGAMGALVLVGISRFALLDIVPVARATLVERMSEGVIVLDSEDRMIDTNPAAQALLEMGGDGVGRLATEFFPQIQVLLSQTDKDVERHGNICRDGDLPLCLDIVITELRDSGGARTGRLIVLRDVTVRERLVRELQTALADVKTLRGLLPICSSCKKIRDDNGYWQTLENYVEDHTEAQFSHGLCMDCLRKLYPSLSDKP